MALAIGGAVFGDAGTARGDPGAVRVAPVTVTPTGAEASAAPAPRSSEELRAVAAARPTGKLSDFKRKYGDPPDATLGRIRIPAVGVDAALGARIVGPDGELPLPWGPADVVWYDFSGQPGYGGALGGRGNAIFAGHVDYADRVPYAGVMYRGLGVFSSLDLLAADDLIEIETGGRVLRDSVTLITCAGAFDFTTLEYSDRLVIRGTRLR